MAEGTENWTKGPWRADDNLGCKRVMGNKLGDHRQPRFLTEVCCTPGLSDENEDAANARLIAAAPDLAAAAAPLAEYVSDQTLAMVPDHELIHVTYGELRALAAALSRARGETSGRSS